MNRRTRSKVEKQTYADKICELQRDICEHERFLGDLLIMLYRPKQDRNFIKHETKSCEYFESVWDRVCELMEERDELAQKLKAYEEKQ